MALAAYQRGHNTGLDGLFYLSYGLTGPLNYPEAHSFVATPHQGIALGLLVIVGLFHAALGVQMIIEDYIPFASGRLALVMMVQGRFLPSLLC